MINLQSMYSLKSGALRRTMFIPLFILTLIACLSLLPHTGLAVQDSPVVKELKQKAQQAYIGGHYAEAAAADLEIALKHPLSEARRYAVQMLGTLYEDNLIDLKKAIKWDREFLKKYADSRQIPTYKEKIASLEKLLHQEQAFKTYQAIRFANENDEIMVKKFEALLKEQPGFLLKDKVESELGYAYARMDKRKQSYQAFQAIASEGGENRLSASDRAAYEDARRYWQMSTTWAWVAWVFIVILWAAVLLMKPWKQLTWVSSKKFMLWSVLWVVLVAACMPLYYKMETTGYPIVIPDTTVFIAAGLNLAILFWLLLLTRANLWKTRPGALLWLTPVLTLLMTASVFYLMIVYHPQGPYITDVFGVKLEFWKGELREWGLL
jgi:hypothetical protein